MSVDIVATLGEHAKHLLEHQCRTVPKDQLHLPGPDFLDRVWMQSDRNPMTLRNMQSLFGTGRLGGTGYLSLFPIQPVAHRVMSKRLLLFRCSFPLIFCVQQTEHQG